VAVALSQSTIRSEASICAVIWALRLPYSQNAFKPRFLDYVSRIRHVSKGCDAWRMRETLCPTSVRTIAVSNVWDACVCQCID